jgi:hypothetical protein
LWGSSEGGDTAGNRQPPEPDVAHDHIRLREHQIGAIACIGLRIRAGHMEQTGTVESGETVGGSSSSSELSPGGRSTKMITTAARTRWQDSGQVRRREPAAIGQIALAFGSGLSVAAPCTRDSHPTCFATSLQVGPRSRRSTISCAEASGQGSAATHRNANAMELIAGGSRSQLTVSCRRRLAFAAAAIPGRAAPRRARC